jgi:hypothetical protein
MSLARDTTSSKIPWATVLFVMASDDSLFHRMVTSIEQQYTCDIIAGFINQFVTIVNYNWSEKTKLLVRGEQNTVSS